MSIRDTIEKFDKENKLTSEPDREEEYWTKESLKNERRIEYLRLPKELEEYQEFFDYVTQFFWMAQTSFKNLVKTTDYLSFQLKTAISVADDLFNQINAEVWRLEEKKEERREEKKAEINVGKIIEQVNTEMDKIKDLKKNFESILKEVSKE